MQIAILLYDRFTALDAIGPYEVLSRLDGAQVIFAAERPGPVRTDTGMLTIAADAGFGELAHPDIVLVPGGPGQEAQLDDGPAHEWLRQADAATSWTTSVCTGSLILAAAGLLQGRRATSHWLALDRLAAFGARPASQRVVVDGKYVTAAGVSAGIDMALNLSQRIAGTPAAQAIQLMLEYDPRPPLNAGSPAVAPPEVVAAMRRRSRHTPEPSR
jgi:putative intracellular protease/amidase